MANRFWVGGAGTWDASATTHWSATSGGASGASVPTSADDVFLDGGSGTGVVTIAAGVTVNAKSVDHTGYAGTLTAGAAGILVVYGPTLKFVAGMTLGNFTIILNGGITCAVTCAGKSIGTLTVQLGGAISQQDALSVSGTFTLTQGGWVTNNFAATLGAFSSSNSNARTLTLGSSAIAVTGGGGWSVTGVTNLTVTTNTATLTLSGGSGPSFNSGSINWNGLSVVMTGSGTIRADGNGAGWTVANFTRTGTASKTDTLNVTVPVTVTGTLTLNSNSDVNRLLVQSNVFNTPVTITAANVVITNTVDFQDITAAGAATWTVAGTGATYLGNCGGNTGITFTVSATQTHTASAGGNWSDATKWTSRVPLPQDDVVVNVNTTGTLTADMPRIGRSIDFTGFAGTWTNSLSIQMFGSLTLGSAMTVAGANFLTLSGRSNYTVASNGKTFTPSVSFANPNGTYTLADALVVTGASGLSINNGTFNAANFNVTATGFTFGSTATVTMGTGTWTPTGTSGTTWSVSTLATVSGASSTIVYSFASTSSRTFAGGGKTYGTLTYTVAASPGALVVTGANTFDTINVGSGRIFTLPSSAVTTARVWNVNGADNSSVGMRLPGVVGNYVSAPDSAAVSVANDITIDTHWAMAWLADVGTDFPLASKWESQASNNRAFSLRIAANTRRPIFYMSADGVATVSVTSTADVPFASGADGWVRVTRRKSDGRVQFFTSTDGVAWTQLGTDLTLSANVAMFDSTALLEIGSASTGVTVPTSTGRVYRTRIYSDITQTTKVFDADFTTKPFGANTFTEASSNAATVTINGALAQVGDGRVALTASTPGTAATVRPTSTATLPFQSDYLTVQDSTAQANGGGSGTGLWFAGEHSTSVSGNTGWIFGRYAHGAGSNSTTSGSSGAGHSLRHGAGASTTTSASSGAGHPLTRHGAGSSTATPAHAGAGHSLRHGSGSITATTTNAGTGRSLRHGSGASALAATTTSGTGASVRHGAGGSTVTVDSSGTGTAARHSGGTSTCSTTSTGSGHGTGSGTSYAVEATAGAGHSLRAGSGSTTTTTTSTGSGRSARHGFGSTNATTTTTGHGHSRRHGAGVTLLVTLIHSGHGHSARHCAGGTTVTTISVGDGHRVVVGTFLDQRWGRLTARPTPEAGRLSPTPTVGGALTGRR